MVRETETEVPHEQTLRGGGTLLLQERDNVALTDGDGAAQPPFAQAVRALTAAERQQLSVIVLCGIVRVLLSVTGPVNGLLHTSINFMTLPEAFRPIYIISGIWQGAGWASIMYTASLSNASKDLKEAAMIDGANLIQQIMTVEWPAIKDMVVIQFILQAGNIMSIGFEKAYALQTDLNLNTAEIIATYVYKKGLLDGDYSFSTAVGLFNTVVNVILLIAVNKVVAKMNDGKGL